MAASAPRSSDRAVPDKAYFKIGEVAKLVGVATHVLRFWESEFGRDIRPTRTKANQRVYRRKDVEVFLRIKQLRHDEGMKLDGTKRRLRVDSGEELPASAQRLAAMLTDQVRELLRIVDEDEAGG